MAAITSAVVGAGTALYGASQQKKADKALRGFTPGGFSSAGLNATFDRNSNRFSVRRSAEGQRTLDALRSGFNGLAGRMRGLQSQVRPGFGRLTQTRVDAIRGAGRRTVGNLREELSKRRVLGSSFAAREIGAQEAEFGRMEEEARAESFLQELEMTRQLIGEEYKASLTGAATVLDQLNFESGLAAQLGQGASQQMQASATSRAMAASAAAGGAMDFAGTIVGAFGDQWIPSRDPSVPATT